MSRHHIFVITIGLLFGCIAVLFLAFPRSTFSELERRELKSVPEFSLERLAAGSYTADVSSWFSDTEPFRDLFMNLSMTIKKHLALKLGGDNSVVFRESDNLTAALDPGGSPAGEGGDDGIDGDPGNAKIAAAGIMLVGEEPTVRALMNYGGEANGGGGYARMLNEFSHRLPGVRIYAMVIPTAIEFYCPDNLRGDRRRFKSQKATVDHIHSLLEPQVGKVDVIPVLDRHKDEDIYLRTDHHWAPLGAHYAAGELARVAGVPFRDLSAYDRRVVHRFVGTMYGYSKDISVKNSPEDFVYFVPKAGGYTTTYINFSLDKDFHITGESRPVKGAFFYHFNDGSGGAYSTFMGGDSKIVKVDTGTANGRRLVIIKDSFGNALPSNLFGSFEQIHVIDFRYFPRNLTKYCRDNGITDLVVAINIFSAYNDLTAAKIKGFLHDPVPESSHEETPDEGTDDNTPADSVKAVVSPTPAVEAPDSI